MTTTSLRALEQEKYNSLCLQLENNLSIVQINAFCVTCLLKSQQIVKPPCKLYLQTVVKFLPPNKWPVFV